QTDQIFLCGQKYFFMSLHFFISIDHIGYIMFSEGKMIRKFAMKIFSGYFFYKTYHRIRICDPGEKKNGFSVEQDPFTGIKNIVSSMIFQRRKKQMLMRPGSDFFCQFYFFIMCQILRTFSHDNDICS